MYIGLQEIKIETVLEYYKTNSNICLWSMDMKGTMKAS
jgi:hypothetical protein